MIHEDKQLISSTSNETKSSPLIYGIDLWNKYILNKIMKKEMSLTLFAQIFCYFSNTKQQHVGNRNYRFFCAIPGADFRLLKKNLTDWIFWLTAQL
jgi:hypothetical protein